MKPNQPRAVRLCAIACTLLLAGAASRSLAQNTNPTNTFDTASSTTSFVQWWGGGGAGAVMTWDGTLDAANDPLSGSVNYNANFVGNAEEQFMTFFTIANRWQWDGGYVLDATTYTNLSFDIKVNPSSGQRVNANDYGWLEIGLVTQGWGTTYLPGRAIPLSATAWTHFDYPLDPTLANINQVVGFFIKMWSNGGHTNSLIFNIDNFMITKPTAPVIIPPPTVSLIPSKTKLNCLASGTGQYDRQQVKTVADTLSWIGQGDPVTYEFTIKDAPGASRPGFQAHMFMVPNSTDNSPSIDWNAPNLLWLHIEQLANGGGQVTLRYKTNLPGANDMLFNNDPAATRTNVVGGVTNITVIGAGELGTIESPNILGTWKVTASQGTNFTVYASDGSSTNFTITEDAAALFGGTMRVAVGAQPNNVAYVGSGYAYDHVRIGTPSTAWVEDSFTSGSLDTNVWVRNASDAAGVHVVPVDSRLAINWTLPAAGFGPQLSADVASGPWVAPISPDQYKIGSNVRTYLYNSELNANVQFARMIKRLPYQLLVLMPGETNAPGTATGKVGTPLSHAAGELFDVTVMAVSADWYLINNVNDTIRFTSSDSQDYFPTDPSLSGGVGTWTMYFFSTGSRTVTASDLTNPSILSNTSSAVTVTPP